MLYRIAGATFRSVSYALYLLKRCEMKICEKTGVELPLYPSIFIIPGYAQKKRASDLFRNVSTIYQMTLGAKELMLLSIRRDPISKGDFRPIPIPKHSGRIFYPNSIYLYL